MKNKSILLIFTFFVLSTTGFAQTELHVNKVSPLTIGETIEVKSEILKENRTLNIYLPIGYSSDSSKSYPVIYLLAVIVKTFLMKLK